MRRITDKSRCAWEWHNFNIEHWYHWNQFRFYWVRIKKSIMFVMQYHIWSFWNLTLFFAKTLILYNPPIAKLYFSILLMLPALWYGNYKPCRFKYNAVLLLSVSCCLHVVEMLQWHKCELPLIYNVWSPRYSRLFLS